MKGLSLEVKVGLLILVSGGLLAAFLFVLTGVRLTKGYDVFVDFENPGSVQGGAAVKIGGIKVGSVEEVSYLGNKMDPRTQRRALIRMRLRIDEEVRQSIHEDALFYVTAQGVLAEQYIAIDPGSPDKPRLRAGAILQGVDPPRLDLALSLGYELLETVVNALRNSREELRELMTNVGAILRTLNQVLGDNREKLAAIITNIEGATAEANSLLRSVRTDYVDNAQTRRILSNLDRTMTTVSRDIGPILADVRSLTSNANEAIATLGPEQRDQLRTAIENAAEISERANRTLGDAQQIVTHIREGRGTVGSFVMDEEIYDDVQELIRDLKHNPWKFFWRE